MRRTRRELLPYVLIAPVVLVELVVHVIPIALAILFAFLKLDEFTLANWTHAPSAGFENFRFGLNPSSALGSAFYSSLERTALFTVLVVAISWCLGMFAAVMLTTQFRGRGFLRAYFLVPFALPAYATGVGWQFILGHDNGALNHLLVDDLHITSHPPFWLIGGNAFWALVLVAVWRMWPFAYLMLFAAVQVVPAARYEAAALGGASAWQQFRHVTLPGVRRTNAILIFLMALWSFNEFTVPFVLFGGNPPQSASLVSVVIYQDAFSSIDVGLASALDAIVVVILLIVGSLYIRRVLPKEAVDA